MGKKIVMICTVGCESADMPQALQRASILAERLEKDNPPLKVQQVHFEELHHGMEPTPEQLEKLGAAKAANEEAKAKAAEEPEKPAKRKRRTKAEIEADKKAKAEAKAQAEAEAEEQAKADGHDVDEDPTPSGDEEVSSGDDTEDLPPATVDDVRKLISSLAAKAGDASAAAKILNSFGYKSAGKIPEDALPKVAQAFRDAIDE